MSRGASDMFVVQINPFENLASLCFHITSHNLTNLSTGFQWQPRRNFIRETLCIIISSKITYMVKEKEG